MAGGGKPHIKTNIDKDIMEFQAPTCEPTWMPSF